MTGRYDDIIDRPPSRLPPPPADDDERTRGAVFLIRSAERL